MAQRTLRHALIVHGTQPVNAIVLPPDAEGDAYLQTFHGVAVVPDAEDEYQEDFLTLTGCVLVEVTGMEPMPGVGNGWTYVDGAFVAPPVPEDPDA